MWTKYLTLHLLGEREGGERQNGCRKEKGGRREWGGGSGKGEERESSSTLKIYHKFCAGI